MTRITEEFKYTKKHLTEYIKCKADPIYFIKNYFNIQHPVHGAILLHLHPYQEDLIRSYEDNRFNIVLPARQVGTTAVSSAYILWFSIFQRDKTTLIASDKHANAREILSRIRYGYECLPQWFQSLSKVTENNKSYLSFDNDSRIVAQTTSACAGCGMSISLLYIDSLAFVKPTTQYEFWLSIRPTIASTQGKCIISSAPNKDNDLFAEMWQEAQDGKNGFYPVRIDWSAPPGRDENFKQDMVNCMGEKRWRQEYECEFLAE